ncbi:DUF2066 domain-containing protein [Halopseudomonas maritima]|uniref:DUF2066 domain-containing protein n=1 Tax=Halopseudomonas maritima TaxID=2918528 RepID=UPI001EEA1189|nr:DUF2066 domain-containing protein [Halopseudomonas maritima]UJJ32309.1 DUF2066 domain-containing protein [Halopseudomonas maritima]
MPLSRFFSIGFFSLCLPLAAHAAVLDSLYQVQMPPHAEAEQSAQLSGALDVMLERLAGDSLDAEAPALAKVLAEPSSVTRQISALQDDGSMQVDFDPLLLRDALTQAQVPMLGRNRPGVLVWAVQRDELGADFMAPGGEMGQALRTAARFRGVALMQPLSDLQDRASISEEDVLDGDVEALKAASERYASEGILALDVYHDAGEDWRLEWTFWLNDRTLDGKERSADPAQLADGLMRALALEVHSQYAVGVQAEGSAAGWTLQISGINSVGAFADLQRSLQQLSSQHQPSLVSISGDQVVFAVDFPGDQGQLERMLMLDQRLIRTEAPAAAAVESGSVLPVEGEGVVEQPEAQVGAAAPANTLYYRWR